jgi:hypothetical protein
MRSAKLFMPNEVRTTWLVAAVVVGLSSSGAVAPVRADDQQDPEPAYRDLASFTYGSTSVGGFGSKLWPTGFTLVSIDTGDPQKSRIAVSAAFDLKGPDVPDLRLLARDQEGKRHSATSRSAASASGRTYRVVTLVCEFALPEQGIQELVIQQRSSSSHGRLILGGVSPRIIIQEEEEKLLGVIEP